MPLYPGPNICTFVTYFAGGEGPTWTTTTYWEAASQQANQTNILAVATAYHGQFAAVVTPILHESVRLVATRARIFAANDLIEATYTEEKEGAGTGDVMPRQDAIVIQKKTGKFGRSYQGRIFLSGIDEEVVTAGQVAPGSYAAVKAVATFLGANRTFSIPYHARHWNRKMNTFYPITQCLAVVELKSARNRQWSRASTPIG